MKRTLLLTVLLAASFGVTAKAQLIDIQFGGNTYGGGDSDVQTGAGVVGSSGDYWNDIVFSGTTYNTFTTSLNNVGGTSSGVSLSILANHNVLDEYSSGPVSVSNPTPSSLPGTSLANLYEGFLNADSNPYPDASISAGSTFTFSGLTSGQSYDLYIYSAPNRDRASDWSLNGATAVQVGTNSGATTLTDPNNYIVLTGIANGSDQLVLQASAVGSYEIDVNGFQLEAATSAPEPATYGLMIFGLVGGLIAFRVKRSLTF